MTYKINTFELSEFNGGFNNYLFDYGVIREAVRGYIDYTFNSGIYVIESDCFDGGWALSSLLAGKEDCYSGRIIINDTEVNAKELRRTYSCMVGDESELRRFGFMHMTVKEQIKYGVRRRRSYGNSYSQIVEKFSLPDSVLNRRIENVGTERWRASMAIGYANGKMIYCLPWINSIIFEDLAFCWSTCIPVLASSGAIVIYSINVKRLC